MHGNVYLIRPQFVQFVDIFWLLLLYTLRGKWNQSFYTLLQAKLLPTTFNSWQIKIHPIAVTLNVRREINNQSISQIICTSDGTVSPTATWHRYCCRNEKRGTGYSYIILVVEEYIESPSMSPSRHLLLSKLKKKKTMPQTLQASSTHEDKTKSRPRTPVISSAAESSQDSFICALAEGLAFLSQGGPGIFSLTIWMVEQVATANNKMSSLYWILVWKKYQTLF